MSKTIYYSHNKEVPNSDFQYRELPNWLEEVFVKEDIRYINFFPEQLEICFFSKEFRIMGSAIKTIEEKGYYLDHINTYGIDKEIMLVFVKESVGK